MLTTPNKPARIRLKISKKAQRGLKQLVRKKHRAVVKVRLNVSPAAGGTATPYTKKTTVKAGKRNRFRR